MRTLPLTGILLLTIYSFNSCNICSCKKIPCPAFENTDFQNWFAYSPGQQIIFKHQAAYDTIHLSGFRGNDAYEASQGCYHSDYGCDQYVNISSYEIIPNYREKLSIRYGSQTPFGSTETKKSISLFVRGFDCSATDINSQGLVLRAGSYSGSYSPSLVINGVSYNSVQTILRDTLVDTFTQQPYKVYIGKGTGLIAYEMFPSHELWIKQ